MVQFRASAWHPVGCAGDGTIQFAVERQRFDVGISGEIDTALRRGATVAALAAGLDERLHKSCVRHTCRFAASIVFVAAIVFRALLNPRADEVDLRLRERRFLLRHTVVGVIFKQHFHQLVLAPVVVGDVLDSRH